MSENDECGNANYGSYNNIVNMRMYENNGQSISSTENRGKSEPKAEEYSTKGIFKLSETTHIIQNYYLFKFEKN
jgi:hypothetical protein